MGGARLSRISDNLCWIIGWSSTRRFENSCGLAIIAVSLGRGSASGERRGGRGANQRRRRHREKGAAGARRKGRGPGGARGQKPPPGARPPPPPPPGKPFRAPRRVPRDRGGRL